MINFQSENKGVWFYFNPENEEMGGICLIRPSVEDYDEIKALTVSAGKPDYHRGQRYETEKTNEKLTRKLSLRKFIVDWKGVKIDGKEIKCTNENKERLVKIQDFNLFFGECLDKLCDTNKTLDKAKLKNSGTSQDGS